MIPEQRCGCARSEIVYWLWVCEYLPGAHKKHQQVWFVNTRRKRSYVQGSCLGRRISAGKTVAKMWINHKNEHKVMDEMSKRNRFWNQCLWMAVFCAALAKPANSDIEIAGNLSHQMPFFEVATTLLHGQVIQLVVSWDGSKDQGRFVDLTIRSNEISSSCPEISCQRLGIDAVSCCE